MNALTLKDAFVEELKDVLSAEEQLIQALPELAKAASDDSLKAVIESQLDESKRQVKRIEQVFEKLAVPPRARKCEGIEGILEGGMKHLGNGSDPEVMDAMLIASSQKAEHYQIASYGSLCAWAEELGLREAAALLRESLDEEKNADRTLTAVAELRVNPRAETGLPREGRRHKGFQA
jgi:ferritin-like metal-binding protein YciE